MGKKIYSQRARAGGGQHAITLVSVSRTANHYFVSSRKYRLTRMCPDHYVNGNMKLLSMLLAGVVYAYAIIYTLAIGAIYLWSIWLGWMKLGLLGAFITMFMPVLGQLVMCYKLWPSDFSILVLGLLAAGFPLAILNALMERYTEYSLD